MPLTEKEENFHRIVALSFTLSALVLQRIILEYCGCNYVTFPLLLEIYKHELFHFRRSKSRKKKCCHCAKNYFRGSLLDSQWDKLYSDISSSLPKSHPHKEHNKLYCPEQYAVKENIKVEECDLSITSFLIINITGTITPSKVSGLLTETSHNRRINASDGLLEFTLDKLSKFSEWFKKELQGKQHDFFHAYTVDMCCQCVTEPERKFDISRADWDTLYMKQMQPCSDHVCSCQFIPRSNATPANLKRNLQLLHRIGNVVGPVVNIGSIRYEIAETSCNEIDHEKFNELWKNSTKSLKELIDIIGDPEWIADINGKIKCLETSPVDIPMYHETIVIVQHFIEELEKLLKESGSSWEKIKILQIKLKKQGSSSDEIEALKLKLKEQETLKEQQDKELENMSAELEKAATQLKRKYDELLEEMKHPSIVKESEKINYAKICQILIGPCRMAMIESFKHIFGTTANDTFKQALLTVRGAAGLVKEIQTKVKMDGQKKVEDRTDIFHRNNVEKYMDITFFALVIPKVPNLNTGTYKDLINKIKEDRNDTAHTTKSSMTDQEFDAMVKKMLAHVNNLNTEVTRIPNAQSKQQERDEFYEDRRKEILVIVKKEMDIDDQGDVIDKFLEMCLITAQGESEIDMLSRKRIENKIDSYKSEIDKKEKMVDELKKKLKETENKLENAADENEMKKLQEKLKATEEQLRNATEVEIKRLAEELKRTEQELAKTKQLLHDARPAGNVGNRGEINYAKMCQIYIGPCRASMVESFKHIFDTDANVTFKQAILKVKGNISATGKEIQKMVVQETMKKQENKLDIFRQDILDKYIDMSFFAMVTQNVNYLKKTSYKEIITAMTKDMNDSVHTTKSSLTEEEFDGKVKVVLKQLTSLRNEVESMSRSEDKKQSRCNFYDEKEREIIRIKEATVEKADEVKAKFSEKAEH